jgi:peptide/nickel transport system substrate-binding protein
VTDRDPHAYPNTRALAFLRNVYEGLVDRGPDLTLRPQLATGWTWRSSTELVFALRTDARFSDGSAVTPADVVWSIERARTGPGIGSMLSAVADVEAGDDTVTMRLSRPDPLIIEKLAAILVASRDWAERIGLPDSVRPGVAVPRIEGSMGSGPYRVMAVSEDEMGLEWNPAWWGERVPPFRRVDYVHVANDATRVAALVGGDIDLATPLPLRALERVEAATALEAHASAGTVALFLAFPALGADADDVLDDVRVRDAINLAIDRGAIVDRLFGDRTVALGGIAAPGVRGHRVQPAPRIKADPTSARRLLAEAGHADGLALTLDCPTDRYVKDEEICTALAPMLARVGIDLTVRATPQSQVTQRVVSGEAELFLVGVSPSTLDAAFPVQAFLASAGSGMGQGVFNVGGFADPALDAVLDGLSVVDARGEARLTGLAALAGIVARASLLIPLYADPVVWGHDARLVVPVSRDGRVRLALIERH